MDKANVPPTCVHLRQTGIYLCAQPSCDWVGWRVIQLDLHHFGPPSRPLCDDSRKEVIKIHLDRLFLAHLETLRLKRSRGSIFGTSFCRNLFGKKPSADLPVPPFSVLRILSRSCNCGETHNIFDVALVFACSVRWGLPRDQDVACCNFC